MTDREYRRLRKRIRRIAEGWITSLGLRWWSIDLIYDRDGSAVRPLTPEERAADKHLLGEAHVQWQYLKARVVFNMPEIAADDMTDREIERLVVHELCHVLVREMREWAPEEVTVDRNDIGMKAEERVVTTLASAFLWTRACWQKEGKRNGDKARRRQHGDADGPGHGDERPEDRERVHRPDERDAERSL